MQAVEPETITPTRRRWHFITGVIVLYSSISALLFVARMYID